LEKLPWRFNTLRSYEELSMTVSRRQLLALATGLGLSRAWAAEQWVEGKHYFPVRQPQAPSPGKVVVTEIFSYGCPACNSFQGYIESLEKKLPAGVTMDYLPASWIPAENWPLFQRAYLTAKALGVADKAHAEMFKAIWSTGELAIADTRTGRIKNPLPSVQDVARFYERVAAVPAQKFIEMSQSFSIDTQMKRADAQIKAYMAESTPTLIVNGKYRLEPRSAGGGDQAVALAVWLAQRELQA
jgi:thiol:disulfide interchange protein DsbA